MYITITLIGRTVPASHDSFYAYIHSTFYHNFAWNSTSAITFRPKVTLVNYDSEHKQHTHS